MVSDRLRRAGREHVVLERRRALGGGWLDRWDAFQLVSPNWTLSVDGFPYRGSDPDGYAVRDEIVDHFRAYAAAIHAPVELETEVTSLDPLDGSGGSRFRLETSRGQIEAREVVVAGGPFQVPFLPPLASAADPSIHQLHLHDYRNPTELPPGGVLLVGSGQSGVQLAEELMAAGRAVTISLGRCGRSARSYRGRDIFWWLREIAIKGPALGVRLPSAATLPDARLRFACNPQLSGHGKRHDTNLRAMARDGLRIAGRLQAIEGTRVRFAADASEALRFSDTFFGERFKPMLDRYADAIGLDLADDDLAQVAYDPIPVTDLDLAAEGISTIVWTSGYRPAFDWIHAPVLDGQGLPRQSDGATDVPGLQFIGTPWLVDMGSANLVGVERDVDALAARWF
jgi:putative flavoprotein involved in K+ transport